MGTFLEEKRQGGHPVKFFINVDSFDIVGINEEFQDVFGYNETEITGNRMKLYDLVPSREVAGLKTAIEQQLASNGKVVLINNMVTKDGTAIQMAGVGQYYQEDDKLLEILLTEIDLGELANAKIGKVLFENILDQLGFGVALFCVDKGKIRPQYFSERFYQILRINEATMKGVSDYTTLLHEDDAASFKAAMMRAVTSNEKTIGDYRIKRFTGGYDLMEVRMALYRYKDGTPLVITTFVDVTKTKNNELEISLQNEMLTTLIEDRKEQLLKYDVENDTASVNAVINGILTEIYMVPNYMSSWKNNARIHKDDRQLYFETLESAVETARRVEIDVRMRIFTGEYIWHRIYFASVVDNTGKVLKVYGRVRDVHDKIIRQEELKNLAQKDSLTGLYNHNAYIEYVENLIETGRDSGKKCALIMLDLDEFKIINDLHGHYVGDELLETTATRIKEVIGKDNVAGRMGGDEFSIFIRDIADDDSANEFCQRLNERLSESVGVITPNLSMGYDMGEYSKVKFTQLYQRADNALYEVKRNGKNMWKAYSGNTQYIAEETEVDSYIEEEGWILDKMTDAVYVCDVNNFELLYVNSAFKKLYSHEGGNFTGKKCYEVIGKCDKPCAGCNLGGLLETNQPYYSMGMENKNNSVKIERIIRWQGRKAKLCIAIDVNSAGNVKRALKDRFEMEDILFECLMNITASDDDSKYRYEKIVKNIGEYYRAEQAILYQHGENGGVTVAYDWKIGRLVVGESVVDIVGPQKCDELLTPYKNANGTVVIENISQISQDEELHKVMEENRIWSVYMVPLKKNEKTLGVLVMFNLKNHTGELRLLNMVGNSLANEMLREQLWEQQRFELYHDALTGLYNRRYFTELCNKMEDVKSVGVIFSDVNGLEKYNSDFGFAEGNRLLKEIGNLYKKHFGKYHPFRFDSDDFVVCCQNIGRDEFINMVERFNEEASAYAQGISCGYVWDDYDMDVRRLLKHAEEMMENVKAKYYESGPVDYSRRRNELVAGVKEYIKRNQFKVYLQPKFNLESTSLCGAEALVRLYIPEQGLVSPGQFIENFENAGAIEYLDLFVLEEICRMLATWKNKGIEMIPISFNFSRKTLISPTIFENIEGILAKYDVPTQYLEVEITESIGEMEYDVITSIANRLHKMGFSLAMDDFGTKYSSIAILSHMRFDTMKIDRSMVNNLVDNEISRKILKHTVTMCQDLGINCIAEGVENSRQAEILRSLNCNYVQGYLYDKPLPMKEFYDKYIAPM